MAMINNDLGRLVSGSVDLGKLPTTLEEITAPRIQPAQQMHLLIDAIKHQDNTAAAIMIQANLLKAQHNKATNEAKSMRAELLKTHGIKI